MNAQTQTSTTRGTGVMNSLERMLAVIGHREPDRVPQFEWVVDKSVIAALTGGGTYWDLVEQLAMDAVMVGPAYRKQSIGGGLMILSC